jgi:hypothetical protein
MNKKMMRSGDQGRREAEAELKLWDALLQAEGVQFAWENATESPTEAMSSVAENPSASSPYPWNVSDPQAEEFFTHLEQDFNLDTWDTAEVESCSHAFFACIDQLWAATTVQETLAQRFANRVPQALLTTITQQAQKLAAQSLSLADQLVLCVQELLPNLAQDDLEVLARPLAYALRNGQTQSAVESTLAKVRLVEWEQLSDMEQARLTLAIARCALAELEGKAQG